MTKLDTSDQATWQHLLSNSAITSTQLLKQLELDGHPLLDQCASPFPLRTPQPFIDKMRKQDPWDPLLLQVLPQAQERVTVEGFTQEPLEEQDYSPVSGLIHKYHSRALLVLTQACAIHCRYCFRRNFPYAEHQQSSSQWQTAFNYIAQHPEINEVILSGGDPLSLPDAYLEKLLKQIEAIDSVKRLRIHSRMLPTLPQRITPELCNMLERSRLQCVFVAHCNHPNELADDTAAAFTALKHANVTLLNQSVLLKQINDNANTLKTLSETLFDQGVLPYYLFTLDKVAGAAHFDLDLNQAKAIYQDLSTKLPGFLLPKLAIETPGQRSKTILSW